MRLCSCGFANPDDATRCAACGSALAREANALDDPLTAGLRPSAQDDTAGVERYAQYDAAKAEATDSALLLEDVRSGEVVRITAPGGILGRAGDFSPDLFSPRVSGVHAVVAADAEGRWTIEHTGRNPSAVERGGLWSDLRCGAPQPLFGGETLKLADMVFRASTTPVGGDLGRPSPTKEVDGLTQNNAAAGTEGGPVSAPSVEGTEGMPKDPCGETTPPAPLWSVRCPVCGTEYAVEGPESRVAACTFCKDPLDARQIARAAARPIPAP